MPTTATRFVWVDMEMTGLDPERCVVLEIAAVITGADLKPIAEIERVIWQPPSALETMEPFVRDMHTKNGLLERVQASAVGLAEAEKDVLRLTAEHCPIYEGILAGNSIHQDRRFLVKYMPALERYLHYRMVDVSSLKVLAQAWYGGRVAFPKPTSQHTALADIRASLAELAYYREHLLRAP
jgi:oligoribonuclease